MKNIKKLKIFNGAKPEVGSSVSGFCYENIEDQFTDSTFVVTSNITAIIKSKLDGGKEEVERITTEGGGSYDLERVDKNTWVRLMIKLDEFRQ